MERWKFELTDTFGGEANYSWVKRANAVLPENATQRQVVRALKKAFDLTGVRCTTDDFGETYRVKLQGACMVAFAIFDGHVLSEHSPTSETLANMRTGGSFATHIAEAYEVADSVNRLKLEGAFKDLFKRFQA